MTGALQMLSGQVPYRHFWYDKPPLTPLFYLLCSALPGWPLRLLGAAFAIACCYFAYRFARDLWDETAGLWAAALLAFFLTFDHHSATIAIAPDVFLLLPHLAAVWLAHRNRPLLSGLVLALGIAANVKAIFLLPVCLLFSLAAARRTSINPTPNPAANTPPPTTTAATTVTPTATTANAIAPATATDPTKATAIPTVLTANATAPPSPRPHPGRPIAVLLGLAPAALLLLSPDFREQVLAWGTLYSADTFLTTPLQTGLTRTLAWCGFHIALLAAAIKAKPSYQWLVWIALMLVTTTLGLRFSPRYYFALLPPLVLLAARGLSLTSTNTNTKLLAAALLLIPLIRFGPRYAQLATGQPWTDLALYQDAQATVAQMPNAKSVFVWGYRPEINVLSRAPSLDFYLESQPLTGVFADRHLTNARRSARPKPMPLPLRSQYVVDGLGPLNPQLAIPALSLAGYQIAGRTKTTVIYRELSSRPAQE